MFNLQTSTPTLLPCVFINGCCWKEKSNKNFLRWYCVGILCNFSLGFYFSYFLQPKIFLFVINVAFVHFMGGTILCVFFCHNLCVEIYENLLFTKLEFFMDVSLLGPLVLSVLFATAQFFFPSTRGAGTAAVVCTLYFLCIKGGVGQ